MNAWTRFRPSLADRLGYARRILQAEAGTLQLVAGRLDDSFLEVVDRLAACRGRIGVTGIGKSGDVAQKIVGTLNSTGTRAYLLDPIRAMHGDLGMIHPEDAILILSHSGASEELVKLLPSLKRLAGTLLGITSQNDSPLCHAVEAAIVYGPILEACPLSLAPSSSTTVMLALGDAIAFVLSAMRGFSAEDFAQFHPSGSLGRNLASVTQFMRRGSELRIASADETVREVFARVRHVGRRTGAIMLTDDQGRLCGLFTDSDLARLLENRNDAALDRPIREVMTQHPLTVSVHTKMADAIELMKQRKFSELPIVDASGAPVGLLDITDVLGLTPNFATTTEPKSLRRSA